jgi:CheY-like chemotaxis protein
MRGRRILIVDDSPLIRKLARLGLEGQDGWKVLDVGSGRVALSQAATQPPSVILLDAVMPDMDGPATLAGLRSSAATRDIPVIFVTATDRLTERAQLQELGAAGVIRKPFHVPALAGQVAAILGWDA